MTELTDHIERHIYQGIGIVEGILELNEGQDILVIGETVYPATITHKARLKHLPGRIQNFRVYPNLRDGRLAFRVINVTDKTPGIFTLKGCWESREDGPRLVIYRNRSGLGALSIPVALDWKDAPAPNGQFWELVAELNRTQFTVLEAVGPFEPPKKAVHRQYSAMPEGTGERVTLPAPIPKAKAKPMVKAAIQPTIPAQVQPSAPVPLLTVEEIRAMATAAKISLTCKLSELPKHRELADKRIEFFLQDGESDRFFTVRMKPKLFKKLTDHGFREWVAAITGEIGPATETGFELVNASVQVFERKAREADTGAEAKAKPDAELMPSAVARPEQNAEAGKGQAKATGGAKPEKGKRLLDGVRVG
jgi:hypothetical protein